MRTIESAIRKGFEQGSEQEDDPPLYGIFEDDSPAVRCGGCEETFGVADGVAHVSARECVADGDEADPGAVLPDGGLNFYRDLSWFRVQALVILRRIEAGRSNEDRCYGRAIGRELARLREDGEEVPAGHLYPNLDELAKLGLVEKTHDGRANRYQTTAEGRRFLREHARWMLESVPLDGLDIDIDADGVLAAGRADT